MAIATFLLCFELSGAASPCPPSSVNAQDGTSVTTDCPRGGIYFIDFNSSEDPLSEGGRWVNGKTNGFDWNDVQTASGNAYAALLSGANGASRYNDSIAHLSASFIVFNADQFAQGTVYRAAGYDPSPSKHEIELHLRWRTTAHNARGYEIMWGITGYLAIVRWNGPLANYTTIYDSGDPGIGAPKDGDVLRAQISGTTLAVYKNGQLVHTSDVAGIGGAVWSTGQPGMGFWPVDSAVKENYGWKSFQAGNL